MVRTRGPRPGRRQRRLGQNFLADTNLLELIVREARLEAGDVVLEVGGGGGALTERLAQGARFVHVVELDERLRPELEELAGRHEGAMRVHWGDALRLDLGALEPAPNAMVANLPYSAATPLLMRSIGELPELERWLVMVQLEIAERLLAAPGSKAYGAPSALAQLCCEVELLRKVPPEVFSPRPRVDSALVRMTRRREAPPAADRQVIRDAFGHRRKALARSLEQAGEGRRAAAIGALEELGLPRDARAESLTPEQLEAVARRVSAAG